MGLQRCITFLSVDGLSVSVSLTPEVRCLLICLWSQSKNGTTKGQRTHTHTLPKMNLKLPKGDWMVVGFVQEGDLYLDIFPFPFPDPTASLKGLRTLEVHGVKRFLLELGVS